MGTTPRSPRWYAHSGHAYRVRDGPEVPKTRGRLATEGHKRQGRVVTRPSSRSCLLRLLRRADADEPVDAGRGHVLRQAVLVLRDRLERELAEGPLARPVGAIAGPRGRMDPYPTSRGAECSRSSG